MVWKILLAILIVLVVVFLVFLIAMGVVSLIILSDGSLNILPPAEDDNNESEIY